MREVDRRKEGEGKMIIRGKEAVKFLKRMERNNYKKPNKTDKLLEELEELKEYKVLKNQIEELHNLNKRTGKLHCPMCFKPMKMQIDSTTGKKSKYIWRCECMPKGLQLMIM